MSARLILHIITTLILFAIGWWMYMRMEENTYDSISSVNVATYWFASLVIAQILALIIAAVATTSLLYVSRDHQQKLEEKAIQQEQETSSQEEQDLEKSESTSDDKPETLNLSEDTAEDETGLEEIVE